MGFLFDFKAVNPNCLYLKWLNDVMYKLTWSRCCHTGWSFKWIMCLTSVVLVDMSTGNDDGQRAAYYILHCWHREHCGPDGETPDATHGLPGLYRIDARGTRGKEAVQDDLPCLWVRRCKSFVCFRDQEPAVCSWEKVNPSVWEVTEMSVSYGHCYCSLIV